MIAFDSSVWIERWRRADVGPRVDAIVAEHGADPNRILVPATVVFETDRWLIRMVEDEQLVDTFAAMLDAHVHVAIDALLARRAALTSVTTGLAAADATILAAARAHDAHLLTFDADFAGIPDVTVLER